MAAAKPNKQEPEVVDPAKGLQWRIRWSVLVAAFVLGLSILAFWHQPVWQIFGVYEFRPYFADTVAVLAAGEAKQAGMDIYAPNPLDPYGRPHVYGPGWLLTGSLGLTVSDYAWVGALVVFLFVVAAVMVVAPKRGRDALLAALFFCSPPVMLGIHRANNDLVVFVMLAAGAWLLASPRWSAAAGAGVLYATAASLKLYPFFALPVLLMRSGRWRQVIAFTALVTLVSLGVVWLWRDDFLKVMELAPRPKSVFAYGLYVMKLIWSVVAIRPLVLTGWIVGTLVAGALLVPRIRSLWNAVPTTGFDAYSYVTGAACWCFCFVANSNFTYRAVLLLLPARLWLSRDGSTKEGEAGRVQLLLWLVVCWLGLAKFHIEPLVATMRGAKGIRAPLNWIGLVCGIEQGIALVLTAALGVTVLGALYRVVRAPRAG